MNRYDSIRAICDQAMGTGNLYVRYKVNYRSFEVITPELTPVCRFDTGRGANFIWNRDKHRWSVATMAECRREIVRYSKR